MDSDVRSYLHSIAGNFKIKDIRTWIANEKALKAIKRYPLPETKKAFMSQQKAIATEVADKLGNTPAVSIRSYISPVIWSQWRGHLMQKGIELKKAYHDQP